MRVLVLGATGMLGHKLMQKLSESMEVVGAIRGNPAAYAEHPVLGGTKLVGGVQAEDIDSVVRALAESRPDAVINAIGLIKQLPGAKNPIPSIAINSLLPHRLAQLSRAAGARFVHVSTDCVFAGTRGMYKESDTPDCVDLYGRSKLLGEVEAEGAITLRTSIVGRELRSTSGLFEWFISQRGTRAKGFEKAIYTGLTTSALADVMAAVLTDHRDLAGVWQVASEPISKYTLLSMLNDALSLGITLERETEFACDRSLDGSRFREATGWTPPSWGAMIEAFASDPTPYEAIRGGR